MVVFDGKRADLLIKLAGQKKYLGVRNLSRGIYACDTSCHIVLKDFEEHGLITAERVGRKTVRTITDKGRDIASYLLKIRDAINNS